jgi:hypothetical protein
MKTCESKGKLILCKLFSKWAEILGFFNQFSAEDRGSISP